MHKGDKVSGVDENTILIPFFWYILTLLMISDGF
jgi:hypothetical protein